MGEEGFWDDQERAAKVSSEHSRVQRRLEVFRSLEADVADLEQLEEMAAEDESIVAEVEEQRASIAGAGGTDSQDWAEMLLRTEMRWAERRGMKVELKEASPGEEAGIKSATFLAKGDNAYGLFSAEKGVHRLVRISPFDSASRRHTAFAGVEVAPFVRGDVDIEIEPDDLQIDTYRASGAGGQHVNKTDSAVRITHKPTGTVVQCQNERSQGANKATAMAMLTSKLIELEEQRRRDEIAKEKGEAQDVGWGSQIRSYVLHPYTMVKDHRTNVEVGNAQGVLDGELDEFVRAELLRRAGNGTS
jgi:peptide chain release factor 2